MCFWPWTDLWSFHRQNKSIFEGCQDECSCPRPSPLPQSQSHFATSQKFQYFRGVFTSAVHFTHQHVTATYERRQQLPISRSRSRLYFSSLNAMHTSGFGFSDTKGKLPELKYSRVFIKIPLLGNCLVGLFGVNCRNFVIFLCTKSLNFKTVWVFCLHIFTEKVVCNVYIRTHCERL